MHPELRRGLYAAVLFSFTTCLTLFTSAEAQAEAKERLTGKDGIARPLQEVIRQERPRGPIYIAIPIAYVFGMGGEHSPPYCSPSIRADNTSNATVQELIVGIVYHTKDGQAAGGTVTRYNAIKVGHQDTHYFYQLAVNDCKGLDGELTVVRCKYASGADCLSDVQAIGFGTIPLHLKLR